MTLRQAAEALTSVTDRAPKTIVGFFAVGLGIVASTTVLVIAILARVPALHRLIVPVLLFMGGVSLAALGAVLLTAWKDPTILMLGQVSGEVYLANRRLTLGDSTGGEITTIATAARPRRRSSQPKTSEVRP
jgi:hypothetical protein